MPTHLVSVTQAKAFAKDIQVGDEVFVNTTHWASDYDSRRLLKVENILGLTTDLGERVLITFDGPVKTTRTGPMFRRVVSSIRSQAYWPDEVVTVNIYERTPL